jgi:hypothetical protein
MRSCLVIAIGPGPVLFLPHYDIRWPLLMPSCVHEVAEPAVNTDSVQQPAIHSEDTVENNTATLEQLRFTLFAVFELLTKIAFVLKTELLELPSVMLKMEATRSSETTVTSTRPDGV